MSNVIKFMKKILSTITGNHLSLPARTTILEAGRVATTLYLVRSGCARLWYNNNGEDITLQFFMPGQFVASFDSILHDSPSEYTLETILPTEVEVFNKSDIEDALKNSLEASRQLSIHAFELATKYKNLFLSRIKDTPRQRYEALLREHPDIVTQIPRHYIATYLGITPVSLSRIRARIGKS